MSGLKVSWAPKAPSQISRTAEFMEANNAPTAAHQTNMLLILHLFSEMGAVLR